MIEDTANEAHQFPYSCHGGRVIPLVTRNVEVAINILEVVEQIIEILRALKVNVI